MKLSAGPGTGDKESALLRAIIDLITSEENTNWVSFSSPLLQFYNIFMKNDVFYWSH